MPDARFFSHQRWGVRRLGRHGPAAEALSLDALPPHQQLPCLLDGRARVLRELLVGSAADRVADDGELVVRHAEDPAHELGRAGEARRHHPDGGYPVALCRDRVVQTAR